MRIRKQAKLAALSLSSAAGATADLPPPPPIRLCHLNQSPWDVISFSPNPFQVDGEDCFKPNGSFGDSIGADESDASMKISTDRDEDNVKNDTLKRIDSIAENVDKEDEVLCGKTDGKGWQCKEKASRGHSLCEHHLAQLKKYNTLAHPSTTKKLEKPVEQPASIPRRTRQTKPTTYKNLDEYYYYEGFGPHWAKKRGERGEPSNTSNAESDEVEEIVLTPPSSAQIGCKEFDYVDNDDEDDDDDNAGESGTLGQKRTRKPIKARSLKSLM
ncbi:hypothetical protein CsSME_00012860 [Camellia sinensis var. sinensis]